MKKAAFVCMAACGLLAQGVFAQTTYYVATNGNNVAPYTNSWADAATNIHAAVALAVAGDTILVSNGVYVTGSELALSNNVTLTGVNGPSATTISRNTSAGSFRVIKLAAVNARIMGVTIANGSSGGDGGGVWMAAGTTMSNCVVRNCVLTGKGIWGNAIYGNGATIVDCVITNCSYNQAQGVVVLTGGGHDV